MATDKRMFGLELVMDVRTEIVNILNDFNWQVNDFSNTDSTLRLIEAKAKIIDAQKKLDTILDLEGISNE